MVKYFVCVIPHNAEPGMRARLESVAGWGEELVVGDFPVSIEGVGIYRCGIRNLDGYGVQSVRNQPRVWWKPFIDGAILMPDVRTCVRVCV
jgi:hypothetical protein